MAEEMLYNTGGVPRSTSDPGAMEADPMTDILRAMNKSNAAVQRMEQNMMKLFNCVNRVEERMDKMERGDLDDDKRYRSWTIEAPEKEEPPLFQRKEVDKKEPKKDESFGQAAKFLRLHTHLKPVKAKPSERVLLEWLEDLTDKMDVTMLNNSDRKIVLQALLQEETCQRLWKPACAYHDVFKDAVEAWLSALYPNSWFLTELFQDLHSKRTYRGINQVVAEVIKTQRLWTEAAARKKMKFEVDIYFWKVVLVNKIPTRFHEKIQELVNAEHSSFEGFCLEVTQKLELLEEKNERTAVVNTLIDEREDGESDIDVYAMKRGRVNSFGNPLLSDSSDVEEMQRPTKRPPAAVEMSSSSRRNPSPPRQQPRQQQRRPNPQRHQENVRKQKEKWEKQDAVCTRCNQKGHTEDSCWIFDHKIQCYNCGGTNHLAICCRSKAKGLTMTFSQQKGESHEELQQKIDKLRAQQEALKNPKQPKGGRKGRRSSQ